MSNPFDSYETTADDNAPAIPTTTGLIPGQRPQSDPIENFPTQPTPEER